MLYADYPVMGHDSQDFADFHVTLERPTNWRRYVRPQVLFHSESVAPFLPLPYDQALPMLEWGMNWCISSSAHSYLIIHAAVLEKNGRALILAAPPGSGKSTLCAALMVSGWRLLSDELTLIRLSDGLVEPVPRPVSLKNASIDVIARYAPDATFSLPVKDTVKGIVAHMRPSTESVERADEPARAAWICFPTYQADSATVFEKIPTAQAVMKTAANAFNYGLLGQQGFDAMVRLVKACHCYAFSYSDLDEAIEHVEHLPRPDDG